MSVAKEKPTPTGENAAEVRRWETADRKAKADIILAISPAELKQVKSCVTSKDIWEKLTAIYQSKGPARKATLLKQLTLLGWRTKKTCGSILANFST